MAHIHELYDFTARAFIVHENKILLIHHKKLKTWIQPGGHVELNEDPEETLWREIKEETGLTRKYLEIIYPYSRPVPLAKKKIPYKQLPMPFDFNVYPYGQDATHKHIDISYLIKSSTGKISNEAEKSHEIRWFSKAEIETMKDTLWEDVYNHAMIAIDKQNQLY